MRIFVTGGTGFIGSHLIQLLRKENHEVLQLSRSKKGEGYLTGDFVNMDEWRGMVKKFKPEAAIHLAWEGVVDYKNTTPEVALRNLENSVGITKLLGEAGCARFVALGSVTDYSDEITPFSVSKTAFRVLGEAAARRYGMKFFWAAPLYIYGPGQRNAALLPQAINSLIGGVAPDIKNPYLKQDFIYVEDVAKALLVIAAKGADHTWYEVGTGRNNFIGHLLNIVYKKFGKEESYKNLDQGDAANSLVANTDSLRQLGWRPVFSVEEGVGKTVDYYRNIKP